MEYTFNTYKVKISNQPYKTEEGDKYSHTAAITFYDTNKHEVDYIEKGYIDKEEVYRKIDNGEAINLNNGYIENFSLNHYRKSRNIKPDAMVVLRDFSAANAIFDTSETTDFSFADFGDNYKNFERCAFINGKVNFHGSNFRKGGINFTYALFKEGELDFAYVNIDSGELNFKNSWFGNGFKNFQNTLFGQGKILFLNVDFNDGDVSFIDTRFNKGNITFKVSRFGTGKVDFHFAKFGTCNLSFERTDFNDGKVDFRTTEFLESKVNFNRSTFGTGEKSFEASQLINGKLTFKKTEWGDGNITFELAEFNNTTVIMDNSVLGKGELSFYNATIKHLSLKSCHLDYYVDLRLKECEYLDLSDTIVRDILDIKPHEFPIKIHKLNFSGMRLIGRIFIDWKANHVKELISQQDNTTIREKSEQYRILKENFNITGQYTDEDRAYVEFKRKEMIADLQDAIERNPWSRIWQYPSYAFRWLVFDKVGLYATDPIRVLISMAFSYFFFALMYFVLPFVTNTKIISSMGDTTLSSLKVAFYHSAITFLTIGYGDYYPQGVIRWLCGLEGFIGLFLMSYFTVAFVRKILR